MQDIIANNVYRFLLFKNSGGDCINVIYYDIPIIVWHITCIITLLGKVLHPVGVLPGALVTCELLNAFHTIEYVMLYVAVFI